MSKSHEFYIQNEEFCIKNEEFCIQNDESCSWREVKAAGKMQNEKPNSDVVNNSFMAIEEVTQALAKVCDLWVNGDTPVAICINDECLI